MGQKNSIKKNIGFQTAYQILNTCLPLITAPYLARVLGAEQLGIFSYTSSIVAYFTLLAMLGTVNYGTRSVAAVREGKEELNTTFWGIYYLQFIVTAVSICLYSLYLLILCKDNQLIATLQMIALIDCLFNINWLFFGLEEFQFTVTRSFFIRIGTVILILLLIHKPSDLGLYTVIMLGGTLLSDLILWFYAPRYIRFKRIQISEIKKHIKPNLVLFVPLLAMSVYHTMDKTMLGLLSTYEQSGFYYNADKVINIPVGILIGIPTVLLPRMTALISSGKEGEGDKLFKSSLEGVVVLSTAIAFGIAAISKEFVPVFFGNGYDECIMLVAVLSPVLIIKGFSLTARNQYLIPYKLERIFIRSVIIGAVINLAVNAALIPGLGAMGAVIGTIAAELIACIIQYIEMRRRISIGKVLLNTVFYSVFGVLMLLSVRFFSQFDINIYAKLLCEVALGIIVYSGLCIAFWRCTNNFLYDSIVGTFSKRIFHANNN